MSKSTGKVKKNNGRKQFLFKWGISAKMFYTEYLNMGGMFKGLFPENISVKKEKDLLKKGKIKMMLSFFKK